MQNSGFVKLCAALVAMSSVTDGHAFMSVPEARNVPNNGDRQSLAAGGPATVNSGNQYRHGLCGAAHTAAEQRFNAPGPVQGTYTEGGDIDISVVVTAHHNGYFDFQLCPSTDISEECFDRYRLRRVNCDVSSSVDDPNCERWWKPLATTETMAFVVTANGGYQFDTTSSGTVTMKARYQLPEGVSCTNCVLRYHWYTTNSCPPTNLERNPASVSEEFWNCADIRINSINGNTPNTNVRNVGPRLLSQRPRDLTPLGLNDFCPQHAIGEFQEYSNVVQCFVDGQNDCEFPFTSGVGRPRPDNAVAVRVETGVNANVNNNNNNNNANVNNNNNANVDGNNNANIVNTPVLGGEICGTCTGCLQTGLPAGLGCFTTWTADVCARFANDGYVFCQGGNANMGDEMRAEVDEMVQEMREQIMEEVREEIAEEVAMNGNRPVICETSRTPCIGCLREDVLACHTDWDEVVCNRFTNVGYTYCPASIFPPGRN